MKTELRFFKKNSKWYADVPGHTLEDNEMVMGTDTILDMIKGDDDEVTLSLSDESVEDSFLILKMISHDEYGAYYSPSGPLYTVILNQLSEDLDENSEIFEYLSSGQGVWICNVTHDVFGEHPKEIYVYGVKQHFDTPTDEELINKEYNREQCVYGKDSTMPCTFCSATCRERYIDFTKKGVKIVPIPIDDKKYGDS